MRQVVCREQVGINSYECTKNAFRYNFGAHRAVQKNSMSIADHVGTCSLPVCVDERCTAASARIPLARRIAVATINQHISAPDTTRLNLRSFTRLLQQSLSAGDADDDGRNILCIAESI